MHPEDQDLQNYISHEHGWAMSEEALAERHAQMREPHPNQKAIDRLSARVLTNPSPLNEAETEFICEKLRTHPDYLEGEDLDIEHAIISLTALQQQHRPLSERCEYFEQRLAEAQSDG